MNGSKLIFVEGLPGTGKTINAQFLQVQLQRNGYDVFKRKYPETGKFLPAGFFR